MTYSRIVLYSYFRVENSCFVVKSDSASMAVPVVEIGYRQTWLSASLLSPLEFDMTRTGNVSATLPL